MAVIPADDLVQLTNDNGGDTIDTTKIAEAVNYVANIINGYIRGRYALPLASVPEELKCLAVDFAVYRLYSRRIHTEAPESVVEKYKNVIKTLELVQRGQFNLGVEASSAFGNPGLKTNKDTSPSSVNRFYDEKKWDNYG
jgi:phage gp36-like protein